MFKLQSKYHSMDITKNLEHYKFVPKQKSRANYSNLNSFSESKRYNFKSNLYNKSKIPPIYFFRKVNTPYKYNITSVPEYLIKTNEEKRFVESLYKSLNNEKEKNILESLIQNKKLNTRKDLYKPKNLDEHIALRYKPSLYPSNFIQEKKNFYYNENEKNRNNNNDTNDINEINDKGILNTCPNLMIDNTTKINDNGNINSNNNSVKKEEEKIKKDIKLDEIKYKYKLSDIFNLYNEPVFTNKSAEKYLFKHENKEKKESNNFYTSSESKSDWIPNKINFKKMGTNSSVDYNILTPMYKGYNKFITAAELNKNNNYNESPNFRRIKSISEFIDLTRVSATNTLPCFNRKNKIPNFKFKNLVATDQADEFYTNKDLIDKAI